MFKKIYFTTASLGFIGQLSWNFALWSELCHVL